MGSELESEVGRESEGKEVSRRERETEMGEEKMRGSGGEGGNERGREKYRLE